MRCVPLAECVFCCCCCWFVYTTHNTLKHIKHTVNARFRVIRCDEDYDDDDDDVDAQIIHKYRYIFLVDNTYELAVRSFMIGSCDQLNGFRQHFVDTHEQRRSQRGNLYSYMYILNRRRRTHSERVNAIFIFILVSFKCQARLNSGARLGELICVDVIYVAIVNCSPVGCAETILYIKYIRKRHLYVKSAGFFLLVQRTCRPFATHKHIHTQN